VQYYSVVYYIACIIASPDAIIVIVLSSLAAIDAICYSSTEHPRSGKVQSLKSCSIKSPPLECIFLAISRFFFEVVRDTMRYSGIQQIQLGRLDTARYVRIQLDTVVDTRDTATAAGHSGSAAECSGIRRMR